MVLKKNELYKNKNWLYNQFVILKKNYEDIANESNCSYNTIWRWLRKFNISEKDREKPKYSNKEWLYRQYVILGKSTIKIGKEVGVISKTIHNWVTFFGFPINRYRGNKSHNWKGGKHKRGAAQYMKVWMPSHPRSTAVGYVNEHCLVMEKHLGRHINKGEVIHHKDLDISNNNINNLLLCKNQSEHVSIHHLLNNISLKWCKEQLKLGNIVFNDEKRKYQYSEKIEKKV